MNYNFSNRISSLAPSAIREILKVTQDPTVISLAAGNPAIEAFPSAEMAELAAEIFGSRAGLALQYGISEGYGPLRETVKARLSQKYNIGREFDDLIIVSGGQQGIELTTKVLTNEGDTIICEDPSFIGSLNAFRSYKTNLVGVPMDSEGMLSDALENALKTSKNPKFIYTIPTFQNPSGRTASLKRRKELLELAQKYDVMILEDNPYFELRYDGEDIPTLKSMDEEGRVIYVGSFSKVLSPGIRLGYVCAPQVLLSKLIVAKQVSDVHSNLFFMILVDEFLKRYDLDAHIEKIRVMYREKRDRMVAGINAHFDKRVSYEIPQGGLFLWCSLPEGKSGMELCALAGKMKVAAVPGNAFLTDESQSSKDFRMNFSLPTLEQIDKGIELFGEATKAYLG